MQYENTAMKKTGAADETPNETSARRIVATNDRRYACVRIERKPEESGDKNFPTHLHSALELFCMVGAREQLNQCQTDVSSFFATLEKGPDGKTSHAIGRACVCWTCGHVGLPKNALKCAKTKGYEVKPICRCGEKEQTNFVQVYKSKTETVPWIEVKGVASAEAVAAAIGAEKKVGRNMPCPCGSKKKYKKCCAVRKSSSS